jgi:hypothetical protein
MICNALHDSYVDLSGFPQPVWPVCVTAAAELVAVAGGASVYIAMTLCDETLEGRIQRKGLAAPAARNGATHPPLHLTPPCCAGSHRESR